MKTILKALPRRTNEIISNRYQAKRFKTSEAMYTFLNKQYDNDWKESKENLKTGVYFTQMDSNGIRYINVKELQM
jgi:hypothetical protein